MLKLAYDQGFEDGYKDMKKYSSLKTTKRIFEIIKKHPKAKEQILKQLGLPYVPKDVSLLHQLLKARSLEHRRKLAPEVWRSIEKIKAVANAGHPDPGFMKVTGKKRVISKNPFFAYDTDTTKVYRGIRAMTFGVDKSRTGQHFSPSRSVAADFSGGQKTSVILEVDKTKLPPELRKKFSRSGPDYSVTPEGKLNPTTHIMSSEGRFIPRVRELKPGEKFPKDKYKHPEVSSFNYALHPRYEQRFLGSLKDVPAKAVKYYKPKIKGNKVILSPVTLKKPVDVKQQKLLQKKL